MAASFVSVGLGLSPWPARPEGPRSRLRPAGAGLRPEPRPLPLLCAFSRAACLVPSQPARGRNSRFSGLVSALRVTIACAGARLSSPQGNDLGSGRSGPKQAVSETTGIERQPVGNRAGGCVIRPDLPTRQLTFLRSVMARPVRSHARPAARAAGWKALAEEDAEIPARTR